VTETDVFELTQPGTFSDPLTEVLRDGARTLLGQAVEAEVAAWLSTHTDKLTDDGRRRGTLVAVFVRKPTPPSLTIKTFPPKQPEYLGPNKDLYVYARKDDGHRISDEKFDTCGLSYISGNENGQCGVSASKDGFWTIQISGDRYCIVTCLKYGAR
jgi:hypothetical protein